MSLARDAYSNQQSKIGNRNGLFGDTQYDNTSMFGDTSDFSEANQRKVLEPFQAKIDAAQRELDNLIKARDGYIKQAEGQKSIESKSAEEESSKSKDELQEEPKGEKLKRKDAVAKDTPEQPDVEAGAVTPNLSVGKDTNETLNTRELEEIISKSKENGTYLKAPNGKDSKLNPEQWVTVRTKRFKSWFGDWEKLLRIKKNLEIANLL